MKHLCKFHSESFTFTVKRKKLLVFLPNVLTLMSITAMSVAEITRQHSSRIHTTHLETIVYVLQFQLPPSDVAPGGGGVGPQMNKVEQVSSDVWGEGLGPQL